MKYHVFATTNLQDTFENVIQSYSEIPMNSNNSFRANTIIAHLPSGSGGTHLIDNNYHNQQDLFGNMNSIICVPNDDNLCAIRAIIIAISAQSGSNSLLKRYMRPHSKLLRELTLKAADKCNISNNSCGIDEFKKLELYFREYQIMVIEGNGKLSKPIFIGNKNNKHIYLSYTGSH